MMKQRTLRESGLFKAREDLILEKETKEWEEAYNLAFEDGLQESREKAACKERRLKKIIHELYLEALKKEIHEKYLKAHELYLITYCEFRKKTKRKTDTPTFLDYMRRHQEYMETLKE